MPDRFPAASYERARPAFTALARFFAESDARAKSAAISAESPGRPAPRAKRDAAQAAAIRSGSPEIVPSKKATSPSPTRTPVRVKGGTVAAPKDRATGVKELGRTSFSGVRGRKDERPAEKAGRSAEAESKGLRSHRTSRSA